MKTTLYPSGVSGWILSDVSGDTPFDCDPLCGALFGMTGNRARQSASKKAEKICGIVTSKVATARSGAR
jgi:hypothetical protein